MVVYGSIETIHEMKLLKTMLKNKCKIWTKLNITMSEN